VRKRLPIRLKLILLAGVPVIGALMLATVIARDAYRQAASAAALGSIEDLARLSARMSGLVHELQFERNELALHLAQKGLAARDLQHSFARTDAARQQLADFLGAREVSSFPPRLARDLKLAQERLSLISIERSAATSGERPLDDLLSYYKATNSSLISATAALSQLTNEGELMRAISALVTVLQIKERASQEHALLSHVFAINEFPAGTYKDLVTLTTEEADYVHVLEVNATDSVIQLFHAILAAPEFTRTAELRKIALDSVSDDFGVQALEWSGTQGKKIDDYRGLEIGLNHAVEVAALTKLAAAAASVRLSYGLGAGVILLSALLAALIARGISRSVASLSVAAERVRREKDFGVRARKTSEDELGSLTDAFNEMLSEIQGRDQELRQHRENLEQLVEQRTAALQKRNEAMRLVLDNVEQGLATIEPDGTLASERSRVFDTWFGEPQANDSFADQLARSDEPVRLSLKLAWEQVMEGSLPIELAIDQMPRRVEVEGRSYNLDYKPIVERESLHGALLVASDVTQELARLRSDAEQRELLTVFERVMQDRGGFIEFFQECEALVTQIVEGTLSDPLLALRALHTVKGNCGLYGIGSVVEVTHRLESSILDLGTLPSRSDLSEFVLAWGVFAERVRRLLGTEEAVIEVAYEELEELEAATAVRAPYARLGELLERLKLERGIVRLRRVAEQAKHLAERLGKVGLDVQVEVDSHVRFPAERWAPFWSAFVHVLRNALDHGIEAPETRTAIGKSAGGLLRLSARVAAQRLSIEISDDGRGIDWERVRIQATQRGLPHTTDQDLVEALFSDGLSLADTVSDVSGRGVGMGAVRDAARALGGNVHVSSRRGAGCTVHFDFALAEATRMNRASQHPGARPSLAPAPAPRSGQQLAG
jgi:two-component system, chemotaxis family, sensor kinase CheA